MTRGSKAFIGKRPDFRPRIKLPSRQELHEIALRTQKRMLKEAGLIGDRVPIQWRWSLGDQSGIVEAFTKGDARSCIKKELGYSKKKKLPKETIIEKV